MTLRTATLAPILAACLAGAAAACGGRATPAPPSSNPPEAPSVPSVAEGWGPRAEEALPGRGSPWVERTLAAMPLRDRIAQMMLPWTPGDDVAEGTEPFQRVAEWVSADHVGGIIISTGTPGGYAAKLNALQGRSRVPLLVVTDLESGPGMRLVAARDASGPMREGGGTSFPPVMGLAAAGSDSLAFEVGRVIGAEARAVGVGLTLSPVLDVNSNADNPIINTRSFGERPAEVARLGAAYVRGVHAGGLLAAGKHFPGHGDTHTDSHIDLPRVDASREKLEAVDLAPFRAAMGAGMDGVLVGHISVPAVEADGVPASMSHRFSTDVLRGEMRFAGLVVTDAMNMGGLTRRYSEEEAAVRAVEAGADLLLQPPHPRQAIDAIERAVKAGRIHQARIDQSVRRILAAKERVGLSRRSTVDRAAVDRLVGSPEHLALAREVARRSITLVRDDKGLVPLAPAARRVLSITYSDREGRPAGEGFDTALGEARQVSTARVGPRTGDAELAALRRRADSADVVVVSVYVSPQEYKGTVSLGGTFPAFVERMARDGVPLVVVSFGSPYLISSLPSVPSYLLAWGSCGVCQQAAAQALLGTSPITGRLPVSLPPRFAVGSGIRRGASTVAIR
jgi:beta-N-acetylhexosaminidase